MWERLLLAAIATLCFYLFLNFGTGNSQPSLFGKTITRAPSLIFNIPIFNR